MSAQRSKHSRTIKGEDTFPSPLFAQQEKMRKTKRNGWENVVKKFRKEKRKNAFHLLVQGKGVPGPQGQDSIG